MPHGTSEGNNQVRKQLASQRVYRHFEEPIVNIFGFYFSTKELAILFNGFSFVPLEATNLVRLELEVFIGKFWQPFCVNWGQIGRSTDQPQLAYWIWELPRWYAKTVPNLPTPVHANFTQSHWTALLNLRRKRNIVIEPADKGKKVAIVNHEDYIVMGRSS